MTAIVLSMFNSEEKEALNSNFKNFFSDVRKVRRGNGSLATYGSYAFPLRRLLGILA